MLTYLGRALTGFAALLLAGAALTAGTQAAQAIDAQVSVVGGAALPTHAPSTDQLTYVISIGDGPVDGVVLHARQPASAPADPASVVVDGAAAPAGTVQQSGSGLVVELGTGADATHGGSLGSGNHTVAFVLDVASLPTGSDSAVGVVDYLAAGQAHQAASLRVPLAMPDLRLTKPAGSGENRTLPLGTGIDGDFEAFLSNSGGDVNAATLTVSLPAGLRVDRLFGVYRDDTYRSPIDTGGTQLRCVQPAASTLRCALGPVASGTSALLDVPVQPTRSAPAGQVARLGLSAVADNGLDAHPVDNTVHASVRFTGRAHLVTRLVPGRLQVAVGRRGRLVALVHNDGPNPALRAFGLVALRGSHFAIVGFTGRQLGVAGGAAALARAGWGARSRTTATAAATRSGVPLVLWNVGTIAPDTTTRAVVTLKARSVGRDEILLGAGSSAGDPPCQRQVPTSRCRAFAFATLVAVKPAFTPVFMRRPWVAGCTARRTAGRPTRRR